jgi:hypothetical protein
MKENAPLYVAKKEFKKNLQHNKWQNICWYYFAPQLPRESLRVVSQCPVLK